MRVGSSAKPAISCDFSIAQGMPVNSLRPFIRSKDSNSSGITRKLYLWKFTTSDWDLVASGSVNTSESDLQAILTGVGAYVSNNVVRVGVEHVRFLFSHTSDFEKMELGVNE